MKVILFGATGMVGQGVLRECLNADDVEAVLAIGRTPTGTTHPKLRDLVHADLTEYASIESELAGYDACFFCLGVSAADPSAPRDSLEDAALSDRLHDPGRCFRCSARSVR